MLCAARLSLAESITTVLVQPFDGDACFSAGGELLVRPIERRKQSVMHASEFHRGRRAGGIVCNQWAPSREWYHVGAGIDA